MRPIRTLLGAVVPIAGMAVLAVSAPIGAQTMDTNAFCTTRAQMGPSSSAAELETGLATLVKNAGGTAVDPTKALQAMYEKRGRKTFQSNKGFGYLSAIDQYVYEQCPGTNVAV